MTFGSSPWFLEIFWAIGLSGGVVGAGALGDPEVVPVGEESVGFVGLFGLPCTFGPELWGTPRGCALGLVCDDGPAEGFDVGCGPWGLTNTTFGAAITGARYTDKRAIEILDTRIFLILREGLSQFMCQGSYPSGVMTVGEKSAQA